MKSSGMTIARVAGVPVVLGNSWYLIAAVVTVTFGTQLRGVRPDLGAGGYVVAFGYAVLLLLSVLVHEIAHALTARALGQDVRVIRLNLWGGHTEFSAAAGSWRAHLITAAVGPLSNAALAGLGWLALRLLPAGPLSDGMAVVLLLLWALVLSNLLVAVFNALPGLPLDGGAVLEAIVWAVTGSRHRGTVVAGRCGRVVAVLAVVGVLAVPWLRGGRPDLVTVVIAVLVGSFMWSGASASVRAGQQRLRLPGLTATRLMHPAAVVGATTDVARARAAGRAAGPGAAVVVLSEDGRSVAVLDPHAAASVPESAAGTTPARAVSRVLDGVVALPAGLSGEALVEAVDRSPVPEYLVVDDERRILGLLVREDVARALRG